MLVQSRKWNMELLHDVKQMMVMYLVVFIGKIGLIAVNDSTSVINVTQIVHDVSNTIISIAGLMVTILSIIKIFKHGHDAIRKKKTEKEKDELIDDLQKQLNDLKNKF